MTDPFGPSYDSMQLIEDDKPRRSGLPTVLVIWAIARKHPVEFFESGRHLAVAFRMPPAREKGVDGFLDIGSGERCEAFALVDVVAKRIGKPNIEVDSVLLLSPDSIELRPNDKRLRPNVSEAQTFIVLPGQLD